MFPIFKKVHFLNRVVSICYLHFLISSFLNSFQSSHLPHSWTKTVPGNITSDLHLLKSIGQFWVLYSSILWPPDAKSQLIGKDSRLGKIEGRRRRRGWGGWMASLTQWTWVWAKLQEMVKDREAWYAAVHGVTSWTWLSDWTTTY